jgi:hypothetical protein
MMSSTLDAYGEVCVPKVEDQEKYVWIVKMMRSSAVRKSDEIGGSVSGTPQWNLMKAGPNVSFVGLIIFVLVLVFWWYD